MTLQGPFGNSYIYGGTTQNGQMDIPQQSSFTAPLEVIENPSYLSMLSINSDMKLTYLSYRVMRLLIVHCRSGETGLIAHLLVTNEGSVPEQGREKSSSFSFYPLLAIDDYYLHYAKQFTIGKAKNDHS